MFKWINAKDRLPEDTDNIVMVDNYDVMYSSKGCFFKQHPNSSDNYFWGADKHFTHWMLLPTPPSRDE